MNHKWHVCLIALAVIAVYASAFKGVFVFDDYISIVHNQRLASPLQAVQGTSRPLTELTFGINRAMAGHDTFSYHAVNVFLHLIAAVLVYVLINLVARPCNVAGPAVTAFSAALLWAVHPINTESVTYIVQRAELLQGLFLLAALCMLAASRWRPGLVWWIIPLALLSALSKPVGLITAPAVLLLDSFTCKGGVAGAISGKRLFYASLMASLSFPLLVALLPNESSTSSGLAAGVLSPTGYFLSQQSVVCHYLWLMIMPRSLCLDYDWPAAGDMMVILPCLLFHACVIVSGVLLYRKGRMSGLLAGMFYLLLLPSSSFFPIADICAEHRMYLPSACVVIAFVFGIRHITARIPEKRHARRVFVAVILLAAFLLALRTHDRNTDYHSELAIWRSVAGARPSNARAHLGIGSALFREGRSEEAAEAFRVVLSLLGGPARAKGEGRLTEYVSALNNLGVIEFNSGRYEAACSYFQEALDASPGYIDAVRNMAVAADAIRSGGQGSISAGTATE